jgi:hypothetical protein
METKMGKATRPTVTVVREGRYRFEGGTLRDDWAKVLKPGRTPWCEITVADGSGGNPWVCSYGGEVWPMAWPELFTLADCGTAGSHHEFTPAGLAALDLARKAVR